MEKLIEALLKMPAFLSDLFTEHLVVTAIGIMVFLLALIVPGRIGSFIRKVVILANILFAMAGGFMGRGQNGYQIICLSAISLLILFIVRLVARIAGAIKQRRIDAKIEERALAKAAKRRGSFKKRQAFSENSGNVWDDDFVPPEESQLEIRKVIEDEINEGKAKSDAAAAGGIPGPEEEGGFSEAEDIRDPYYEEPDDDSDLYYSDSPDAWDDEFDFLPEEQGETPSASKWSDASDSTRRKADALFVSFEDTGDDLPDGVFYARPRPTSGASARQYLEYDVSTALRRLAELRDNGIMTEEEFEEKKTELLSKIQ